MIDFSLRETETPNFQISGLKKLRFKLPYNNVLVSDWIAHFLFLIQLQQEF